MCWHRECQDYGVQLETWHEHSRNKMDKATELARVFTKNLKCPYKTSEKDKKNTILGVIGGSIVLIIAITLFSMWRKKYVAIHTHITTQAEIDEADRVEAAAGVEMSNVVGGGVRDPLSTVQGTLILDVKEHKHKHHHKKDKEHKHKHHHKTKK